jgi:hypothetical protein
MTISVLDISGDDVAQLGDGDLRELVARLCEAEMRQRNLPTSAVTAGGQQEAPDGGLDVRVALAPSTPIDGYVPRPATGFQVKKSDMPRKLILGEMRPKGKVRSVIRELAAQAGAYIIVSSNGSTSDSALRARRKAMAEAMRGVKRSRALQVDFYDRGRIASWLRDRPGLIPWVRQCIGKSIHGWQSYGAWANPSEDVTAEYLLDDKELIRTGKREDGEGISGLEGIARVRNLLREPRKIVRLVGLSGVGKTRFVQALFDERIGKDALDPAQALYTNLGDDPDPQPIGMVSDLIGGGQRAIVVVDNCPPELHRRLLEVCRAAASAVSVISVEYDIRDDTPEETEVIRIEPSSVALIEKLIKRRFPGLSAVDAGRIAGFSGGNARIAIALANTVGATDTISGLGDEELFRRLFEQRYAASEPLLLAAQACSLVYSFEGEALSGDGAELPVLASLIGRSAEEIFAAVAELKRRDLVQQRGVWRAVLPHAIANRLAAMALQNIPMASIEARLVHGASDRLLKSFSRRLGYLDNSPKANALVKRWFAEGGLLAEVTNLSELGQTILRNVAPVAPEAVLGALEHAKPDALAGRWDFAKLLRSLAYDPALFERSTGVLAAITEADASETANEAASCFESLFFVILSGTHATVAQRLAVVHAQLRSGNERRIRLGLEALRSMLEAWHFSSGANFEFGSRSRDYGYLPRTTVEWQGWYAAVLKAAEGYAVSAEPFATEVATIIGKKFRGLWTKGGMYDDLERVSRLIRKVGFWREGWIGVKETLRFDANAMEAKTKARLGALEKLLRPTDLIQKVCSLVLARAGGGVELEDFDAKDDGGAATTLQRRDAMATALGIEAAKDPAAFQELLPRLTSGDGLLWKFGVGLALGADNPDAVWNTLTSQFAATGEKSRNSLALSGFLEGLNGKDPAHVTRLLDAALADEILSANFPSLQRSVPIDTRGVARLMQVLDKAPVWQFKVFAWGRASDPIPGSDLRALLKGIAAKPDGFGVAVEFLNMRLFSDKSHEKPIDSELFAAGRDLLEGLEVTDQHRNADHDIGTLVVRCLKGKDGVKTAELLCQRFMAAVSASKIYAYGHDELVGSLFKVQPAVVLNAWFGGSATEQKVGQKIMEDVVTGDRANPLDKVPEYEIFAWCEGRRSQRYPIIASLITLFRPASPATPHEWTEMALKLLARAPDRVAVLKQYVRRFRPRSWSGSLALAMEAPLAPLRALEAHSDSAVAAFARAESVRLRREMEKVRRHETKEDKQADERFE